MKLRTSMAGLAWASHRVAVLVLAAASWACEPELPPGLGDLVPDARLRVVEASGSAWEEGATVRLSELDGKPILIDFWASWCSPCRAQHAYVAGLKGKYGDRLEVVGVLWEDSEESARAWLRTEGATYPTVRDERSTLARTFWVNGLPRLVLLTPERRLSWDAMGVASGPDAPNADSVAVRLEAMLGS